MTKGKAADSPSSRSRKPRGIIRSTKKPKTVKLRKIPARPCINTEPSTQPSLNQHKGLIFKDNEDKMHNFLQSTNKMILLKYGSDILKCYIDMEEVRLTSFTSFNEKQFSKKYNFRKLLAFFDQAIQHYKLSDETYFLTSHIIDSYLNLPNVSVKDSNEFKLIGLTAFYIASKMVDLCSFRVNDIRTHIGMNLFTSEELLDKELEIVNGIDFDLQIISTYDMIHMMFSDCISYSHDMIKALELKESLNALLCASVRLAKLIECNKSFVNIKVTLKSIGCIVVAFDIITTDCSKLSNKGETFIRTWIKSLLVNNGYTDETLRSIYDSIQSDYKSQ